MTAKLDRKNRRDVWIWLYASALERVYRADENIDLQIVAERAGRLADFALEEVEKRQHWRGDRLEFETLQETANEGKNRTPEYALALDSLAEMKDPARQAGWLVEMLMTKKFDEDSIVDLADECGLDPDVIIDVASVNSYDGPDTDGEPLPSEAERREMGPKPR